MSFELEKIIRKNILELKPYSSAKDEFKGKKAIFLDANENAYGSVGLEDSHNRYPDNLQWDVKKILAGIKQVRPTQIFLGNGSDEAIDLIFRIFFEPGKHNMVSIAPTYGMYEVSAHINDVECRKALLSDDFQLIPKNIFEKVDAHSRAIFLCSPNNPTGNSFDPQALEHICLQFQQGIVVLDEAYIDFSEGKSLVEHLEKYPNLIILQTFSKAWGMANLRMGMAFASEEIIHYFNKVKPPYNINGLTQQLVLKSLNQLSEKEKYVKKIIELRSKLSHQLALYQFVEKVFPSDANFLLIRVKQADHLYQYLVDHGVVVRNRSREILCDNCLRITIGTEEENQQLIHLLDQYQ